MAHESHRHQVLHALAEALTEQEQNELAQDADQSEHEDTNPHESDAEAEIEEHEIEMEAFEHLDIEEGMGRERSHLRRALIARFVLRQTLRAVLLQTRMVARRMHRNASLRRKLALAAKRGPRAVRLLIGLAILKTVPRPFRRATAKLLPLAIRASFRPIARLAGLNRNEIDAAELEYDEN